MKLDVNEKRKLAPLQAYCSYAWESTLRPLVTTRWEQQKKSTVPDDGDDPADDDDDSPGEPTIPLSFKLKIAKELFDKLSLEEKGKIDDRREADKKKMYRRVTEIDDDEERHKKLRNHAKYLTSLITLWVSLTFWQFRNQPLVVRSLNRVLANLEDQTGCVAQLIIASVDPKGGPPSIQKYVFPVQSVGPTLMFHFRFCQGETARGLKFEHFYDAKEWEANVESKFREWAIRVFGGTSKLPPNMSPA